MIKNSGKNELLLSIIVPVFNTGAFLSRCLESICSQIVDGNEKFEIWVSNDGSTDNSFSIINSYKDRYPQFMNIINKENGGVSDAKNKALDKALGRYIWFVDSDDSIESGCIKKILSILKETNADYIYFNAYRVDNYDNIIGDFTHGAQLGERRFCFSYRNLQKWFTKHMGWMRIYKRNFIGDQRFPKGITHEDIHFDLLVLSRCPQILYLNEFFYRHYFDNPSSITNTMSIEKFRQVLWVYEDLYSIFTKNTALKPYSKEYGKVAILRMIQRINYMITLDLSFNIKSSIYHEYALSISKIIIENELVRIETRSMGGNIYFQYLLIKNKIIKGAFYYSIIFLRIRMLLNLIKSYSYKIKKVFPIK